MTEEPTERSALLGGARARIRISEDANSPRAQLSRENSHLGSQLLLLFLWSDSYG